MQSRKKYIVCVLAGVLFSIFVTGSLVHGKEKELQTRVASQILRFHVLANSDSDEDQMLKLRVKEEVLSAIEGKMTSGSLESTKKWVAEHLSYIKETAQQTVWDAGYEYPVQVELTTSCFPQKTYGDITFPAGVYEALRIRIGKADGHNWWCVLYPKLCFMDAVHAVVPAEGKQELKEVLDDDAYEMITTKTKFRIKWFFF